MKTAEREGKVVVLDQFVRTIRSFGEEKVLVRPALTINLFYPQPVGQLGPYVAEVLERYINFVPSDSLTSYIAEDGTIRKLSSGVIKRSIKNLRAIPLDAELDEYHFGQGEDGAVGQYAFSFIGDSLRDTQHFPHKTNWLYMQFPVEFLQSVTAERFIGFVTDISRPVPFSSGVAGHGFAYTVNGPNEAKAMRAITQMAMRLLAFDINYSRMREYVLDRIYTVSWLNLWGQQIVTSLGGSDAVKATLAELEVIDLGHGLLVRASEVPLLGDANRGAKDIVSLTTLDALTRRLRPQTNKLGSENETFAPKWMARLNPQVLQEGV